jgi:hypothetical protein
MWTPDISTSFEMKKQTVAAFLDITGAYDNVLIRCIVRCYAQKGAASGNCPIYVEPAVVYNTRFLCAESMTPTGYKGLPFLYNLLGSGMERLMPSSGDFLQYADDIVMYSSHHVVQAALPWFRRPTRHSAFFFRCSDSRYPLQRRRRFCSLGSTCGLRSRSGLVADCCNKW